MSVRAAHRQGRGGEHAPPEVAVPTAELSAAEAALTAAGSLTVRSLLFGSGPRFAGDAFGPVLAFYVGWKVAGTEVGIGVATAVGIVAWYAARRRERPGAVALLALGFVFVQAGVGLAFHSARIYLAQQVLLSAGLGVAFLVSIALRRPLAGLFAQDIFPFPDEVRSSATFRRVFTRISLAWGVYQVLRSVVRLGALSKGSIDAFLVVNLITSGPFIVALMAWSIWYAVRAFRRSEEWGWALRGEEPPPDVVAAYEAQQPEQVAAQDGRDTGPAR
ncbi:MAG TPA: VC0807 family protein [Acidimicrobiales bacterium]|jgi:intracellular septation protein A|nr:VC0807 family protein [Acidimicrobiales bacterium]